MSVLSELCLPLVKEDGTFIAMKAANANEEIEDREKGNCYTWRKIRRNSYFYIARWKKVNEILL